MLADSSDAMGALSVNALGNGSGDDTDGEGLGPEQPDADTGGQEGGIDSGATWSRRLHHWYAFWGLAVELVMIMA